MIFILKWAGLFNSEVTEVKSVDKAEIQSEEKVDEEDVKQLAIKNLENSFSKASWKEYKMKTNDIELISENKNIEIYINTDTFFWYIPGLENTHYYHDISMFTFIDSVGVIFNKYKSIEDIRFLYWSDGVDKYGNDTKIFNFVVGIDRESFDKVNWSEIEKRIVWDSYDPSIFNEYFQR